MLLRTLNLYLRKFSAKKENSNSNSIRYGYKTLQYRARGGKIGLVRPLYMLKLLLKYYIHGVANELLHTDSVRNTQSTRCKA